MELCAKCYKLAVIMFHDDSEEDRFYLTTRGADVQIAELERACPVLNEASSVALADKLGSSRGLERY